MSDLPNPEDEIEAERPDDPAGSPAGGAPDGGPELGDDVAAQSATGMTGPGAAERAAEEAPASEGELDR